LRKLCSVYQKINRTGGTIIRSAQLNLAYRQIASPDYPVFSRQHKRNRLCIGNMLLL